MLSFQPQKNVRKRKDDGKFLSYFGRMTEIAQRNEKPTLTTFSQNVVVRQNVSSKTWTKKTRFSKPLVDRCILTSQQKRGLRPGECFTKGGHAPPRFPVYAPQRVRVRRLIQTLWFFSLRHKRVAQDAQLQQSFGVTLGWACEALRLTTLLITWKRIYDVIMTVRPVVVLFASRLHTSSSSTLACYYGNYFYLNLSRDDRTVQPTRTGPSEHQAPVPSMRFARRWSSLRPCVRCSTKTGLDVAAARAFPQNRSPWQRAIYLSAHVAQMNSWFGALKRSGPRSAFVDAGRECRPPLRNCTRMFWKRQWPSEVRSMSMTFRGQVCFSFDFGGRLINFRGPKIFHLNQGFPKWAVLPPCGRWKTLGGGEPEIDDWGAIGDQVNNYISVVLLNLSDQMS